MKKKIICVAGILGAVLIICVVLYFAVIHPHAEMYIDIMRCYQEFHVDGIGKSAEPYTEYSVTGENLVTVETADYSISIPSYFEKNSEDHSGMIRYSADENTDDQKESIGITVVGTDYTDMAILNQQGLSEQQKKNLIKGYEKLGYGIPDTAYSSYKCALLITEDDYSYANKNQSKAYTMLIPYRTGNSFFYSAGNAKTYIYENEKMYALISESYHADWDLYVYYVEFYNSEDLNLSYTAILKTKTPQTAYAVINSLTFGE